MWRHQVRSKGRSAARRPADRYSHAVTTVAATPAPEGTFCTAVLAGGSAREAAAGLELQGREFMRARNVLGAYEDLAAVGGLVWPGGRSSAAAFPP